MMIQIYTCAFCRVTRRVDYPHSAGKSAYRLDASGMKVWAGIQVTAFEGRRAVAWRGDAEKGVCACGRTMKTATLKATMNEAHVCNDKCMSSRGPVCSCSCGGANHGTNWA